MTFYVKWLSLTPVSCTPQTTGKDTVRLHSHIVHNTTPQASGVDRTSLSLTVLLVLLALWCLIGISAPAAAVNNSNPVPSYAISDDTDLSNIQVLRFDADEPSHRFEALEITPGSWRLTSANTKIDNRRDTHWMWFKLRNEGIEAAEAIVFFDEAFLGRADCYVASATGVNQTPNGLQVPIGERAIRTRLPACSVTIEPGGYRDVYLAFESRFNASFSVKVQSPSVFVNWIKWQSVYYAFVFGAAAAIILYNLFLFVSIRDSLYLLYCCHASLATLFLVRFSGFSLFVIDSPGDQYRLGTVTWLQVVAMVEFTRRLLETRVNVPRLDIGLRIISASYLVLSVITFFDITFYGVGIYGVMPLTLYVLGTGIYCIRRGNPLAPFYVIAQSGYLVGYFLLAGLSIGLLAHTFWTRYGFILGVLAELVMFSLALGYRFRLLQREKLASQRQFIALEQSINEHLQAEVERQTGDLSAATQELTRINSDYAALLNSIDAGVAAIDAAGAVTFANPAFSNTLANYPTLADDIAALSAQQQVPEGPKDLTLVEGGKRPRQLLLSATERRDEDNAWAGFWVVTTDVTELRTQEAFLHQSAKLARLGEMSTGVAHELNQPLNTIRLSVANLRRQLNAAQPNVELLSRKCEQIDDQVSRAAKVIQHMRTYGRVSSTDYEPFNISDCVTRALEFWSQQLSLLGIELSVETSPDRDSLWVHGSESQFDQVLINLLSNARDAIVDRVGGGVIQITTSATSTTVHLAVSDNGGGIPDDVIDYIFEPFFTTKPVGKGMGVGGSISYGIIKDMGGVISARNTQDGACIDIMLPRIGQ